MAKLLLTILHFLSDKLRALIVIIAVLLVGAWLQHEWQALEQAQQNTAHQQQVKALLQASRIGKSTAASRKTQPATLSGI